MIKQNRPLNLCLFGRIIYSSDSDESIKRCVTPWQFGSAVIDGNPSIPAASNASSRFLAFALDDAFERADNAPELIRFSLEAVSRIGAYTCDVDVLQRVRFDLARLAKESLAPFACYDIEIEDAIRAIIWRNVQFGNPYAPSDANKIRDWQFRSDGVITERVFFSSAYDGKSAPQPFSIVRHSSYKTIAGNGVYAGPVFEPEDVDYLVF